MVVNPSMVRVGVAVSRMAETIPFTDENSGVIDARATSRVIRKRNAARARGGQEVVGPLRPLKLSKLAASTRAAARKWSGPSAR